MERHLKERLIGAAVLVAVGNILITEMLSGPAAVGDAEPASVTADGSTIKTYTIDLRRRDQADPNTTPMPPPELPTPELPTTPAEMPKPEPGASEPAQVAAEVKPAPEVTKPAPTEATRQVKPDVQPEVKPSIKPEAKPEAKTDTAPSAAGGGSGYVVQVASLDNRAAAEKITDELKRAGFASFVMPVEVGGKKMFRVRVGPAGARADADALLARVKRTHPGAAVMRHP